MADREERTETAQREQENDVMDGNVEQTAVPLGPETQAIVVLGLN